MAVEPLPQQPQPFKSLLLHTQNITRSLVNTPSARSTTPNPAAPTTDATPSTVLVDSTNAAIQPPRPTPPTYSYSGELATALHETFHFALDGDSRDWEADLPDVVSPPQDNEPHHQQPSSSSGDTTTPFAVKPGFRPRSATHPQQHAASDAPVPPLPASQKHPQDGEVDQGEEEEVQVPEYISYAFDSRTQTLYIPHPVSVANSIQDPCCGPDDANASSSASSSSSRPTPKSSSSSSSAAAAAAAAAAPNTAAALEPHADSVVDERGDADDTTTTTNAPRDNFDITAKFFLLSRPGASSAAGDGEQGRERERLREDAEAEEAAAWVDEAVRRLTMATGVITVDTLILALPTLSLGNKNSDRGRANDATSRTTAADAAAGATQQQQQPSKRDAAFAAKLWELLSANPQLLSLGLSDVSLAGVQLLFDSFSEPPPPPTAATQDTTAPPAPAGAAAVRAEPPTPLGPNGAAVVASADAAGSAEEAQNDGGLHAAALHARRVASSAKSSGEPLADDAVAGAGAAPPTSADATPPSLGRGASEATSSTPTPTTTTSRPRVLRVPSTAPFPAAYSVPMPLTSASSPSDGLASSSSSSSLEGTGHPPAPRGGVVRVRPRRPRLVTIDTKLLRSPCDWDRTLMAWCDEQGIMLAAGSDGDDILSTRTLETLMSEFKQQLPHPMAPAKRLVSRWCLKYTVLIRDRGVLASKGFIVRCDTE